MTRHFNGWHMTTILVGFFAVVVAVNLVMARYAIGTFGGTVVENSYVASQRFNGWLKDARDQDALGWTTRVSLDGNRRLILAVRRDDAPLAKLAATGTASHPLGRVPAVSLSFDPLPDGRLRSRQALPSGRWSVSLSVRSGTETARMLERVQ